MQTELAQAPDLGLFVDGVSAAIDNDAPSGPSSRVVFVCLEGHQALIVSRGQLGPAGGAEDRILAVYDMVDWQDDDLAVGEEADASDGNGGQQLQASVEWQYLEAA
jgi:hypothetical protein